MRLTLDRSICFIQFYLLPPEPINEDGYHTNIPKGGQGNSSALQFRAPKRRGARACLQAL
jgi:hypothetical protein